MKIGLHLCEQLIGSDPGVIRDYAVLADELGFDHITCVDHVLGTEHANRTPPFAADGIYTEDSEFHEPLTLFAFWAAVTSRIEFCTSVMVLPQRQTALLAKQTAGDRPPFEPPAPTRCRHRLELRRVRGPGRQFPERAVGCRRSRCKFSGASGQRRFSTSTRTCTGSTVPASTRGSPDRCRSGSADSARSKWTAAPA